MDWNIKGWGIWAWPWFALYLVLLSILTVFDWIREGFLILLRRDNPRREFKVVWKEHKRYLKEGSNDD